MDGGVFVPGARDQGWVSHALQAPPRRSVGRFLERDLSEQALRQPAEPVFDRRELQAAKQAGFEAGREAGLAEAAASRAQAESAALGEIAVLLESAQDDAARVADAAATAIAHALVSAMAAAMPELIRRSALGEAESLLQHILPGLSRELQVRVEVPRDIAAGVGTALARLSPDHHHRIDVISPERMAPGDVRVCWASGHARRQPAALWQAVMELLEPALGQPDLKDHDDGQ